MNGARDGDSAYVRPAIRSDPRSRGPRSITRRSLLIVSSGAAVGLACRRGATPAVQPPPVAPAPPARPAPAPPLRLETLARFIEPLPIPPVLKPMGTRPDPRDPHRQLPFHRVLMTEAAVTIHRDLPLTRVWTYGAAFPGPTIEARRGQPLQIEWINALPAHRFLQPDAAAEVRAVVHVHGALVPPQSEGVPDHALAPGQSSTVVYPNQQDAATLWYHDGALGAAALNQDAGLTGLFLVRDPAEASLGLPDGPREIPLVLADCALGQDGQLREQAADGRAHLVNGKLFPFLAVEARRYRLRIVNASTRQEHRLSFAPPVAAHQIGGDQGLLAAPVPVTAVRLVPGERADLVVDFGRAAGMRLALTSGLVELLQFRVSPGAAAREAPWPRRLRDIPPAPPPAATRTVTLAEAGPGWSDPITERPRLGTTEAWNLVNATARPLPFHLHGFRFRVVGRAPSLTADTTSPPEPGEGGWKDTVRVDPGTVTRISISFAGFAGRSLWDCQVPDPGGHALVRPFEVVRTPT